MWTKCQKYLQDELPPTEFSTWIRPLKATFDDTKLNLKAPNRFVLDWVREKYLPRIQEILAREENRDIEISLDIAPVSSLYETQNSNITTVKQEKKVDRVKQFEVRDFARSSNETINAAKQKIGNLNRSFNFDSFVQGNSNQLAMAAAKQVA